MDREYRRMRLIVIMTVILVLLLFLAPLHSVACGKKKRKLTPEQKVIKMGYMKKRSHHK
tara:strand:- start:35 stop:211 length:177 start_codon:yes stop_codon:yes gene_type:complete